MKLLTASHIYILGEVIEIAYIGRRWAGWFDGVDDYVEISHSDSLDVSSVQEITVFGVVRVNNVGGEYRTIIRKGWGTTNSYAVGVNPSGYLQFDHTVGGSEGHPYPSNYLVQNGELLVFVVVIKQDIVEYYVDGILVDSVNKTTLIEEYNNVVRMGKWGNYHPTLGDFYTIIVWYRALSDSEIQQIYNDPFNPDNIPKDGLVGWWDFNKADWTNGILPDLSGNGNDGQISGVVQRDVLVKRGTGDLPEYDLLWSWVCDGIDDYVYVPNSDYKLEFANKNIAVSGWLKWYGLDGITLIFNNAVASGIGLYDSVEDKWHINAGEVGYFVDYELDGYFRRPIRGWPRYVKVADNSQAVPLFRVELVDVNSGNVILSKDVYANVWDTATYKNGYQVGEIIYGLIPEGKYRLRLYSYGNVEFWIEGFVFEDMYATVLTKPWFWVDRDLNVFFRLYHTGGSQTTFYKSVGSGFRGEWVLVGGLYDYNNQLEGVFVNDTMYVTQTADYKADLNTNYDLYIGSNGMSVYDRFLGEIASIMIYDRVLDQLEVSDLYSRKFVLDGLVHWWVVDGDGNLVDLVTGNSYVIQGNPYIRRLYDDDGRLNSGTGVVVFDIIKDERGQ